VGCCYAAGAFSCWSVLDIFFGVRSDVVFSLGSVPRWYFLWGPFRGYISLLASGVVTGSGVSWTGRLTANRLEFEEELTLTLVRGVGDFF
jgi:hypothetical protein